MREARRIYFEENCFGEDGGYSLPTVTVVVLGLPISIPNTEGRKKAVVFHDLHHVLTGYKTNNMGESEISAWELGSGCASYPFALGINILGLLLGIFQHPKRLFRAFVRGRSSCNLYGRDVEKLLERDVESLREELKLNESQRRGSLWDLILFCGYLSIDLILCVLPILCLIWIFL